MSEIQIYGPYFTNFSYARVNRGLAIALNKIQKDYKVSLYCDPAMIDYLPNADEVRAKVELKDLVKFESGDPHIVIYNNFPKSINNPHGLKDLKGDIKVMYIAWEESVYPSEWVDEINENIHGVMAATTFVREILRSSGVKVPITVVPNAMDSSMLMPEGNSETPFVKAYPLTTNKKYKFLHISTAKKRKGIDVLLKAYFEEFTNQDNVVLIIKSFPGPDNSVDEILNNLRSEKSEKGEDNAPEVLHINNPNLTEEELTSLIQQASVSVYPSRAEGFGLPILESMYNKVPVIATNYSGYLDFLDDSCGYLIDYKLEYAKDSEFANIGAKWAEPDVNSLRGLIRELYENKNPDERLQKIKIAKERANGITWENSAKMTLDFVKKLEKTYALKNKSAGVISFINDETGIAEYTDDLYKKIEHSFANFYYFGNADLSDKIRIDDSNVLRLWSTGEKDFTELKEWLQINHLDIMHIQYHSGSMFPPESLDILIQILKNLGIKTFVTLHAVKGDSFDFIKECKNLKLVEKVFIHNKRDFEYAKSELSNVSLFTIPVHLVHKFSKEKIKKSLGISDHSPIIATHGLLNKNKGVDNIVRAVSLLKEKHPGILFLSLSAISSNNIFAQGLFDEINVLVAENNLQENVIIIPDFLDEDVVNLILQASDINIFAYSDAGESGSAAVRKGLNAMNPTIVTDITQFFEFESEVLKIPSNDPKFISTAVESLLQNEDEAKRMVNQARDFVKKNNYETKSLELLQEY